ncbi:hypothetical protein AbraIFM66950_005615 [Aspergillus brasiliensis]|nr:hypothetical protein AbraIFM66950_005615 [Aspergillus brasiliensis]
MAAIEYPSTASVPRRHHEAIMEAPRPSYAEKRAVAEERTRAQAELEHVVRLYNMGKPLFPRSLLKDLHEQISQGKEEVMIPDIDDKPQTYGLRAHEPCTDFPIINYSSIQRLIHFDPRYPSLLIGSRCPVSIQYTPQPNYPSSTSEEIHSAFEHINTQWLKSETCSNLGRSLVKPRFLPKTITKIVAFGLGTLGKVEFGNFSVRSFAQHAAMITMASALKERNNSEGCRDIQCFVQDPYYDEKDIEFLTTIGITVVNDPQGFLEIDEQTLVFSVCPNIPVRQIVADVQWPAAMIWNSLTSEEEMDGWRRWLPNGEVFLAGPMMTDPDSDRVCEMVRYYNEAQLFDPGDYFGDLTVYARKSSCLDKV